MERKPKIGFWTKLKANRQYVYEIPIEGKRTDKMLASLNDAQYAAQVIRAGNCLSKINPTITDITANSFWDIHQFEEMVQTVYWTFKKGFCLHLIETMKELPSTTIDFCLQQLHCNPAPYLNEDLQQLQDEEMAWAIYRDRRMSHEREFKQIFDLDKGNRKRLLDELNKIALSRLPETETVLAQNEKVPFNEMLRPMEGEMDTLYFIKEKIRQAGLKYNPMAKVETFRADGKNPTYFNGCVAAVIGFFFDHNFFFNRYSERDIFYAWQKFTHNKIGKLNSFISEYRNSPGYKEGYQALKALKIGRLK